MVSGAPGAGKTSIATRLSARLGIPMARKDAIKESLFESLGWSDREWSKKLGCASIVLMFDFVDGQLAVGRSLIAESNFYPHLDGARVRAVLDKYDAAVVEVHCTAAPDVLLSRNRRRQESDERHPGHVVGDAELDQLTAAVADGFLRPLDPEGEFITVDTTDFARVDLEAIVSAAHSALVRD